MRSLGSASGVMVDSPKVSSPRSPRSRPAVIAGRYRKPSLRVSVPTRSSSTEAATTPPDVAVSTVCSLTATWSLVPAGRASRARRARSTPLPLSLRITSTHADVRSAGSLMAPTPCSVRTSDSALDTADTSASKRMKNRSPATWPTSPRGWARTSAARTIRPSGNSTWRAASSSLSSCSISSRLFPALFASTASNASETAVRL
jgi:hypothetical protein